MLCTRRALKVTSKGEEFHVGSHGVFYYSAKNPSRALFDLEVPGRYGQDLTDAYTQTLTRSVNASDVSRLQCQSITNFPALFAIIIVIDVLLNYILKYYGWYEDCDSY